jgi:hypothetical protein
MPQAPVAHRIEHWSQCAPVIRERVLGRNDLANGNHLARNDTHRLELPQRLTQHLFGCADNTVQIPEPSGSRA